VLIPLVPASQFTTKKPPARAVFSFLGCRNENGSARRNPIAGHTVAQRIAHTTASVIRVPPIKS
jgi:hypothetical protein